MPYNIRISAPSPFTEAIAKASISSRYCIEVAWDLLCDRFLEWGRGLIPTHISGKQHYYFSQWFAWENTSFIIVCNAVVYIVDIFLESS
jgi:hypothetical protein